MQIGFREMEAKVHNDEYILYSYILSKDFPYKIDVRKIVLSGP